MAVDSKRETYETFKPIWKRVEDFCAGEDAVKARKETYLPKLPSQTESVQGAGVNGTKTLYDLFLEKASVWPGAAKTLRAFLGILTRKPPEVTAPADFQQVFSLAGENVYSTAAWAAKGVMQTGLAAFLVEFPEGADRPFAVKYRAKDILDWRYRVAAGGRELVYVSLVNQVQDGEIVEVVHLSVEPVANDDGDVSTIYVARTYHLQENNNKERVWVLIDTTVPLMADEPLDFIPFVPISEQGLLLQHEYPMLLDVVNLNKAHYQNDAEYRNALTFAGRPTPCVSGLLKQEGQESIQLGTTKVLQFEQGGNWGFMGLDNASGIQAIRQAGQDLQADMAVAGSQSLTGQPNGVEAAQTAMIHREGEHGQLSTVADVVSEGVTRTLQIMGIWAGRTEEMSYEINTDFNPRQVDAQTIQTLWQMYMNGDISFEVLWYNMQKGELTPALRGAEEEKQAARADREARTPDIDLDEGDDDAATPAE